MSGRAVFLDRDGVLTEPVPTRQSERPPWTMEEVCFVEGGAAALQPLRSAGFLLVMITNQPDVARGQASAENVAAINDAVACELELDAVYVCAHDGEAACACRKPLPGMVLNAARDLDIDLSRSWLVGDRWVDIAAGRAAGVRCVLLKRPGSWLATSAGLPPGDLQPDVTVGDLTAAVRTILDDGC